LRPQRKSHILTKSNIYTHIMIILIEIDKIEEGKPMGNIVPITADNKEKEYNLVREYIEDKLLILEKI